MAIASQERALSVAVGAAVVVLLGDPAGVFNPALKSPSWVRWLF